jgi:organic solute transporter subunit alpha
MTTPLTTLLAVMLDGGLATREPLLTPAANTSLALPPARPRPPCAVRPPPSHLLFAHMPVGGWVMIIVMLVVMLVTVVIYIEEIIFVMKAFRITTRRKKTIWVLAFFPVFSVCSFIGLCVPRAGTFVNISSNLYFSTCLYQLLRLFVSYMGGTRNIWKIVGAGRRMRLNTLPICCCCPCCPTPAFNGVNLVKLYVMVMQMTIIRPIMMFLAAVLWHDELFIPGQFSPRRSFLWIGLINATSTVVAVWGLCMFAAALEPELGKTFAVRGKIASIQGTLILTVLINSIISMMVASGRVSCNPLISSRVKGEQLYFTIIICLMFLCSLLGRKFFRRVSDGNIYAAGLSAVVDTKSGAELLAIPGPPNGQQLVPPTPATELKVDVTRQSMIDFLSSDANDSVV